MENQSCKILNSDLKYIFDMEFQKTDIGPKFLILEW